MNQMIHERIRSLGAALLTLALLPAAAAAQCEPFEYSVYETASQSSWVQGPALAAPDVKVQVLDMKFLETAPGAEPILRVAFRAQGHRVEQARFQIGLDIVIDGAKPISSCEGPYLATLVDSYGPNDGVWRRFYHDVTLPTGGLTAGLIPRGAYAVSVEVGRADGIGDDLTDNTDALDAVYAPELKLLREDRIGGRYIGVVRNVGNLPTGEITATFLREGSGDDEMETASLDPLKPCKNAEFQFDLAMDETGTLTVRDSDTRILGGPWTKQALLSSSNVVAPDLEVTSLSFLPASGNFMLVAGVDIGEGALDCDPGKCGQVTLTYQIEGEDPVEVALPVAEGQTHYATLVPLDGLEGGELQVTGSATIEGVPGETAQGNNTLRTDLGYDAATDGGTAADTAEGDEDAYSTGTNEPAGSSSEGGASAADTSVTVEADVNLRGYPSVVHSVGAEVVVKYHVDIPAAGNHPVSKVRLSLTGASKDRLKAKGGRNFEFGAVERTSSRGKAKFRFDLVKDAALYGKKIDIGVKVAYTYNKVVDGRWVEQNPTVTIPATIKFDKLKAPRLRTEFWLRGKRIDGKKIDSLGPADVQHLKIKVRNVGTADLPRSSLRVDAWIGDKSGRDRDFRFAYHLDRKTSIKAGGKPAVWNVELRRSNFGSDCRNSGYVRWPGYRLTTGRKGKTWGLGGYVRFRKGPSYPGAGVKTTTIVKEVGGGRSTSGCDGGGGGWSGGGGGDGGRGEGPGGGTSGGSSGGGAPGGGPGSGPHG
jgi:hypothetical protein